MADENLTQLLAKRAPKPRAKSTTALIWILILCIGILLGGAIGKGAASSPGSPPSGTPASIGGGGNGFPKGTPVRGTVGEVGAGTVTIDTRDSGDLAPGDEVVVLKAPAGAPAPVSP